jgi:hypothetical protein
MSDATIRKEFIPRPMASSIKHINMPMANTAQYEGFAFQYPGPLSKKNGHLVLYFDDVLLRFLFSVVPIVRLSRDPQCLHLIASALIDSAQKRHFVVLGSVFMEF